ncbi:hypothetical protein QR680_005781 [Steinernema hermaphroditum]|uniref:Uncharacterized protein n=1 Tax=Steinernema hermaphroditum TaxID=289476 RepID=A0AA39HVL3_9BILA|nr:hypothetical protein QR680_005781 [Steinernema hermaphroditum]
MFGAVFLLYLAFLRCGDSDAIVRRKIDDFDDSVRDLLHVKNVSSPGRKVEVRFEVYYAEQVLFEENNIRGDLRDPAMLNWTTVKRLKSWSPRRYCEFLHQLRNVTVFDLEGTIARECNFSLDWKVDVIWISPRYNQYYIVLGDFYDYRFIEKMFCRSPFTIQEEFYEKVVKRFHGEREHANSFASFKALCARINAEVHQLCYESQVMRGEQCIKGNFNNSGILIKREVRDLEDNVFCTFLQVLIAFYKSGHDEMLKMEHYRCRPIALLEFAAVPPENPKFVIVGNFNNFEFVRKVISQLTTDELKCTFFKKAIVSKHGDSEESTYADMYSTCVVKEMIRSKGSDRTEPSSIDETTTTQKVEDDYYWKMTGEKVALLCIIVLSIVVFNVLLSSIFWFIFMMQTQIARAVYELAEGTYEGEELFKDQRAYDTSIDDELLDEDIPDKERLLEDL